MLTFKRFLGYGPGYEPARVRPTPDDAQWAFVVTIAISALLGALYGALVEPLWSEAVEFGQAWGGLVAYTASNPWYQIIVRDPSLQITVPALMLLAGMKPWSASLVMTGFFGASAFSAISAATYAFSRHLFLAICAPLLLLTYI